MKSYPLDEKDAGPGTDPRRLILPNSISTDPNAFELLTAWFHEGSVKTMTVTGTGLDRDPAPWGDILAGIAQNVALSIQSVNGVSTFETLATIKQALMRAWPDSGVVPSAE